MLDKVGTYGMIRFCLQLFPEASQWATPVVITLAVISVLYGALLAIGQTDIMRLIAYTSISHFGFIVLGIFAMTSVGFAGLDALHGQPRVHHGGAVPHRRDDGQPPRVSKRISDFGGWQRVTPVLAGSFLVAGLSGLALPGLARSSRSSSRWSGTFQRYPVPAVIATLGIILAALYILLMYKRMMTGPSPQSAGVTPVTWAAARSVVVVAAHRLVPRARLLPEAGPRHDQPGGSTDARLHGRRRPRAHRPRQRGRGREVTATALPSCRRSSVAATLDYAAIAAAPHRRSGSPSSGCSSRPSSPRRARYAAQVAITLIGLLGAFLAVLLVARPTRPVTLGGVGRSSTASRCSSRARPRCCRSSACSPWPSGSAASAPTRSRRWVPRRPGSGQEALATRAGYATSEVFPLALFAICGMMLFLAASDLITMFVGARGPLAAALHPRRPGPASSPALAGGVAEVLPARCLLLGVLPLRHGAALRLRRLRPPAATSPARSPTARRRLDGLLVPGVVLLVVGLLFKIGAVPFHAWIPDAYQGAPTPVTGFMAACTKLAAFGAILRVVYVGIAADRWDWAPAVTVVAILTMIVGAVLSVTQTDIKRMLAYSSIAHAGFILVGVLAFDRRRQRRDVLPRRLRPADHRGVRHRRPGPRPGQPSEATRTSRSGRVSGAATRSPRRSSPSCCWPSPASR